MPLPRSSYSTAVLAAACVLGGTTFSARAEAQEAAQPAPQPAPTVVIQYQTPPPQQYPPPPQQYQAPMYQQQQPIYIQQPQVPQQPSGPRVIKDWDGPVPPGYHPETRTRTGLVVGGAVMFGTVYLFTALGASVAQDNGGGAAALYVPGLGPFIQMASCGCNATGNFGLALDGVVQIGGIAMFIAGFAAPKTVFVRNDFGFELHVAPIVARDQSGLALVGRF